MMTYPNDERQPDGQSVSRSLDALLDEIADRQNEGEMVDFEDYCQRYPEHAETLREFRPLLLNMQGLWPDENLATLGAEEPPIRTLGDYSILREIGRGGMGVIYEAE